MANYWISADVRVAIGQHGIIWLDLKRDRYLGIKEEYDAVLSRCVHEWPTAPNMAGDCVESNLSHQPDLSIVRALEQRRLITKKPPRSARDRETSFIAPDTSFSQDSPASLAVIRWHHVWYFVVACAMSYVTLRIFSLKTALHRLKLIKSAPRRMQIAVGDEESVRHLMAVFKTVRLFVYTARLACLFDSIALFRFLSCYGVSCTLVIGIVPVPFAAHCWIQRGGTALNSDTLVARRYQPIAIV